MKKARNIIFAILLLAGACRTDRPETLLAGRLPDIFPDYAGVTLPCNIAPPNFAIREKGDSYRTEIYVAGSGAAEITLIGGRPKVNIPAGRWKALLGKASGRSITIRVSVRRGRQWTAFDDIRNDISADPIDPYLVYRLLYPGYELWNEMGIYQRNLASFAETPVAENRNFGRQCVNCHSFRNHSPDEMMLHVRGKNGGTIIRRGGATQKVNPKPESFKNGATYPSWHPSGKYIAFSANDVQQFFHSAGAKAIEVADLSADMMVYDVETGRSSTSPLISAEGHLETFPDWSPDGKHLYFCRAAATPATPLDSIRYDLYRIAFDEEGMDFHTLECLYEASAEGKSASFPQVSPDGRYLMFTLSDYGNFSIWHPESDLYLMDLASGAVRGLHEANSGDVDSYHTWSSSGRWFVFSSKRIDGLWARPYFAHFDPESGAASKPFLLPQKDPAFYDTFLYTYNRPELLTAPVRRAKELERAARGD